jgi:predicted DNA-binding transcriptional regulator AlpA
VNEHVLPEAVRTELKELIREVLREEFKAPQRIENDRLVTPEQAAEILGQNVQWVYRHASQWSFTRRLSRKSLRFSEAGLRRWLATKKPPSSR